MQLMENELSNSFFDNATEDFQIPKVIPLGMTDFNNGFLIR
jgi:hypothetical protein